MPGADSSNVVGRSLCGDDGGRAAMRHIDYLEMMLRNGHAMSHDYSHQSTDEDPHMIAFFDSLVRRERDGWTSDEDEDSLSRDDDADDHALDYHHTEQSSSDESTSDGNRPRSGVVFRPLRYPQPRETGGSGPADSSPSVEQSTASDPNLLSRVRLRRKSRRSMLQRLGQTIPITSFVSSHSPMEDSSSESTSTATVNSSSEDSDNSESSSNSRLSESSNRLSEPSNPADQSPFRELFAIPDPCREIADPLTLRQSRESLTRLKRLREHALNSDDDGGEFSLSSPPSVTKYPAVSNPLPPPTSISADICDNLRDRCKSPVKLNGKSQPCSESANGANDLCRFSDFTRNSETREAATVCGSASEMARQSSAAIDQELCGILNQVSNGDATGVNTSSADRFHSRRRQTKSGSRRYRQTVVDNEADHTTDED